MTDNKVWAYTISTREQSCTRQRQAIEAYAFAHGLTIDCIFEEKVSGKNFQDRPIWNSLKLTTMRAKDSLIITEIDRLGRNYEQIRDEFRELEKLGIDIIVLENDLLSTANKTDLERTLISNVVFELLSYVSEKERRKLRDRQAAGIALAKANGKYLGRKKISIPDNFEPVYRRWRDGEITAVAAMGLLNVKKDVFYRIVKERGGSAQHA